MYPPAALIDTKTSIRPLTPTQMSPLLNFSPATPLSELITTATHYLINLICTSITPQC